MSIVEKIRNDEIVSLNDTGNMAANTPRQRYSKKEKMHHLAQKSKQGATSNAGNPLSDFQRGVNYGRAQEIGNQLGDYKWRKSNKEERAQLKAERKAYKDKAEKKREKYFAKLERQAAKAAEKASRKGR